MKPYSQDDPFAALGALVFEAGVAVHEGMSMPPLATADFELLARLLAALRASQQEVERYRTAVRAHLESIAASRGRWQPIGIVVDNLAVTEKRLRSLISGESTDA